MRSQGEPFVATISVRLTARMFAESDDVATIRKDLTLRLEKMLADVQIADATIVVSSRPAKSPRGQQATRTAILTEYRRVTASSESFKDTYLEIAKRVGCGRTTVYTHLKIAGAIE